MPLLGLLVALLLAPGGFSAWFLLVQIVHFLMPPVVESRRHSAAFTLE
jgi:hypothetical protein